MLSQHASIIPPRGQPRGASPWSSPAFSSDAGISDADVAAFAAAAIAAIAAAAAPTDRGSIEKRLTRRQQHVHDDVR